MKPSLKGCQILKPYVPMWLYLDQNILVMVLNKKETVIIPPLFLKKIVDEKMVYQISSSSKTFSGVSFFAFVFSFVEYLSESAMIVFKIFSSEDLS